MKPITILTAASIAATLATAGAAADRTPLPAGAQRCISRQQLETPTVLGTEGLLYRNGRKSWINRFRGGVCPAQRNEFSTIITEQESGQPCEGDHVRFLDPGETIPGPVCILGPFEPYVEPAKGR